MWCHVDASTCKASVIRWRGGGGGEGWADRVASGELRWTAGRRCRVAVAAPTSSLLDVRRVDLMTYMSSVRVRSASPSPTWSRPVIGHSCYAFVAVVLYAAMRTFSDLCGWLRTLLRWWSKMRIFTIFHDVFYQVSSPLIPLDYTASSM